MYTTFEISSHDSCFSSYFSSTLHPPYILYAKGDSSLLHYSSIGIVGSRNPTAYGISMCQSFTQALAESGLVIISGLAKRYRWYCS